MSTVGRGLLYAAAVVVVIAGLKAASSVVIPLLLATFIAVLSAPVLMWLEQRLSFPVAFAVVIVSLVVVGITVSMFVGASVKELITALPGYQDRLAVLESQLVEYIDSWGMGISREDTTRFANPDAMTGLFTGLLNGLVRVLGDSLIVLLLVAFMLTEAAWFPRKIAIISPDPKWGSDRVREVVINIRRYIGIKTLISIATGVLIALSLYLLGIDYPMLWGFLAFAFNYVPTIGSVLAGVPAVVLALLDRGWGIAAAVAVIYLVVNQLLGSVIEPRLQGRGLGLSPLVVFVSLLFWGWVFGPVGMLLSAPLTMLVKISVEGFEDAHWLAVLLGGKPPDE